jgi:hypothetical protein
MEKKLPMKFNPGMKKYEVDWPTRPGPMKKVKVNWLWIILILIFISVIFGLMVRVILKPISCTEEGRVCADGSVVSRIPPDCEFEPCPDENLTKNYCTQEQRNADACIEIYQPVCGWNNENIQCIRYPCAQTYSNSCFACIDENVAYWTEGECPKGF